MHCFIHEFKKEAAYRSSERPHTHLSPLWQVIHCRRPQFISLLQNLNAPSRIHWRDMLLITLSRCFSDKRFSGVEDVLTPFHPEN